MSETLHDCPKCGRKNFTARGLRAHVCRPERHPGVLPRSEAQYAREMEFNRRIEDGTAFQKIMPKPTAKKSSVALVPVSLEVVSEPAIAHQFSTARVYLDAGRAMANGAAAFMVLAGGELKRLHALYGVKRGGDRKSKDRTQTGLGLIGTWAGLVKRELGISDESARNYMALFDAAKERVKALRPIADELLVKPLGLMNGSERSALLEKLKCALPASSAMQLMSDWGIARGRGGKPVRRVSKASDDDEPAELTAKQAAQAAFETAFNAVKGAEEALLSELVWADLTLDSALSVEAKLKSLLGRFHERVLQRRHEAA